MNRRRFITTASVGTVASLGGCLSVGPGSGGGRPQPIDGEWVLRSRIVNEDDEPREWRIESRSEDRESVGAAWATVPAGESWEVELSGQLFDEQREIHVESERGSTTEPWRPADCPRLLAEIAIVDGEPRLETDCHAEGDATF